MKLITWVLIRPRTARPRTAAQGKMMQQLESPAISRQNILLKVLLVLLGIVVLVGSLAFVYYQNPITISFKTSARQYDAIENQLTNPQIQVVAGMPEQLLYGLKTADQSILQSADYSKSFLVIVFFGLGSSDQDEITNIWQRNGDIWVQAKFVNPPENSEKVSPYQIIQIDKSELSQFGNISFRLLDSEKMDKAKMIQTITPEAGQADNGS